MLKKGLIVTLAVIMVLSTALTGFAVEFTDISTHWGRTHIERMAQKGIVSGSDDPVTGQRVYLPDDPVTKVETMVMIYSTLRAMDQLVSDGDYTSRYQSIMNSAKIPEWAQRQVAYAIEAEVISTANLAGFMEEADPYPIQQSASREEVAIYFGKAIDHEDEAVNGDISLTFDDTEEISSQALPYVNYLVEKNIVSGDDLNHFNPRATITRAEMAALMSKTVEAIEEDEPIVIQLPEPTEPEEEDEEEEPEATTGDRTFIGEIQLVSFSSNLIYVREESRSRVDDYAFDNNTRVFIRGIERGISSLDEDQTAEFTLDEDQVITRIEVDPEREKIEGTLRSLVDMTDDRGYYVLRIVDEDRGIDKTLEADEDIPVKVEDNEVDFSWLTVGEKLVVYYTGDQATRIEKLDTINEAEGTLVDRVSRFDHHITLRSGNTEREYELGEDLYVRIDGNRAELYDLMEGDILMLRLRDGKVTRIDAKQVELEETMEGTVVSIRIARTDEITIEDRRGDEHTFEITEGVRVYIDDERKNLSDLRSGDRVELVLRSDRVLEINLDKGYRGQYLRGVAETIYDRTNQIEVRRTDTARGENVRIYVDRDTRIFDIDRKEISLSQLNRNALISVRGEFEGDIFVADLIDVLED